jgi:hypothetical protein
MPLTSSTSAPICELRAEAAGGGIRGGGRDLQPPMAAAMVRPRERARRENEGRRQHLGPARRVEKGPLMRAEIESVVDEIEQAIALLRRHL